MSLKKVFATGIIFALAVSLVSPGAAVAETADDLQAQIAALQVQLDALLAQLGDLEGDDDAEEVTGGACPVACAGVSFSSNLSLGANSSDVKCLQAMLNRDEETQVASSSYGSPGNETTYYGNLTKAAVVKFQEKYSEDCLASWGLTVGTGFFGSTSRAKMNYLLTACAAEVEPEPEPVGEASDYDNETDCAAANYYWYGEVCNETAEESPVTASGLTIAVANDTPVATTLADGSAYNSMLKLKLSAGSEGDVNVTGLKVTKGGISGNTYVEGILVVDENGNRHGAVITSLAADSTASLTFSDDPIVVSAGQSVYVTVQVNLGASFGSGTISMKVASASDVTSNASAVSGSFPVQGNTMSVVDGVATIGGLYVDAVQFHNNGTADATAVNVNLGTVDQIIGKLEFTESAASASEDVQIEKVTIYNNGNTTDADIANIDLVAPDGTVLATLPSLSGKYGTFDLSSSPYVIPDGTAKIVTLRCDVVSGSTRTVRFLVESDYDVVVSGVSSGSKILATADATTGDNAGDHSFPIGDRYYHSDGVNGTYINKVTIASGSLSVSKSTTSPSGNVAARRK